MQAALDSTAQDSSSQRTLHVLFKPQPAGPVGSGAGPAAASTILGPDLAKPETVGRVKLSATDSGQPRPQLWPSSHWGLVVRTSTTSASLTATISPCSLKGVAGRVCALRRVAHPI